MTRTITATYDGRTIHPDQPLPLARNTRVTLTVHAEEPEADVGATAFQAALAGALEEPPRSGKSFAEAVRRLRVRGPADWSERVDEYLGRDVSGGPG